MGKRKQNAHAESVVSFTDTSLRDYSTKKATDKSHNMRSDSCVQSQISALLSYGESSLENLTEMRSDCSFTGTENLRKSDGKYSISRFTYNDNVYDEIMKRMSNEENDKHIKDDTKVGSHQFLTYQILIKTNDEIYFIKPEDKKYFLLNKSSVSEMVAPTTAYNSKGDKICVAKYAFVQVENSFTTNSKNSTIKSCKDSQYSKNELSSSETEPHNRMEIESKLEANQKIFPRPRSDLRKQKKISDISRLMIRSAKKETCQMKKMSHATYSRPYLYNNIIFYSTATSIEADQVFQDRYLTFLKNRIKNKLSDSANENKNMRQSGGDQNPENKNTALTTEYVDHFWERNKMRDCKLLFTLEPEFYTKAFQSKCNVKSQNKECLQPTRLSDIFNRPSKHDFLLTNLLDLKLRDIMSYVWNSSSKTKLPSISGSQEVPLNIKDQSNRDASGLGESNFSINEDNRNVTLSVSNHCTEKDEKTRCLNPSVLSKQLILIQQDPTNSASDKRKTATKKGNKSSLPHGKNNDIHDTAGKTVSKFTTTKPDPENQSSSPGTSLHVHEYSGTRSDDMFCNDTSFNDLSLLQAPNEEENKCVLALSPNEDQIGRKTDMIEAKKSTGKKRSQNIVDRPHLVIKPLMSIVKLSPSSSKRSRSRSSNLETNSTISKWHSRSSIQSKASLSTNSSSSGDNQQRIRQVENACNADQFSSRGSKNKQLLRENILERVIPEDSIISLCSRSHDSINKLQSPACTSESACLNNIEVNPNDRSRGEKTYSYTENDLSASICNLSVLAVELDGDSQNLGKNWYSFPDESRSLARKSLDNFEGSANDGSDQILMTNCSLDSLIESNGKLLRMNEAEKKRKIQKRKSNTETARKTSEKPGKSSRRTFAVKGFKSEKSLRNVRSHRNVRKNKECKDRYQRSLCKNQMKLEKEQNSFHVTEQGSPVYDVHTNINCDVKNVAISCSEGNFKKAKEPRIGCVSPKRLQKKKDQSKRKNPEPNVTVTSHCEGSKVEVSRKSQKRKQRPRNNFEKDETRRKRILNDIYRTFGSYTDRKYYKNLRHYEKNLPRNASVSFLNNEFPERIGSESSLSSYKTVNSFVSYDEKSCKDDLDSEISTESTSKSAIQTFIGPSAIDGMLNIINLFYARQKPDECSCVD